MQPTGRSSKSKQTSPKRPRNLAWGRKDGTRLQDLRVLLVAGLARCLVKWNLDFEVSRYNCFCNHHINCVSCSPTLISQQCAERFPLSTQPPLNRTNPRLREICQFTRAHRHLQSSQRISLTGSFDVQIAASSACGQFQTRTARFV